jgi:hypothetical protein
MTCLDDECPLAGVRHSHKPQEDKGLSIPYIDLAERARLVEASRVARNMAPKRSGLLKYPGYKGEPSVLPGMKKS